MAPLLASISAFLSAWRWCSFCGTWASEAAAVGTALVVAIPQSKSARWFFIRSTAPAWYLLSRCLPTLCKNAELASPPLDSKPHVRHRSDCDISSNEKDSGCAASICSADERCGASLAASAAAGRFRSKSGSTPTGMSDEAEARADNDEEEEEEEEEV